MPTNITVDQQRLVLNTFAAYFQNNLVSADAVTWKQYDSEYNAQNRLSVSEQVGPRYAVTRTKGGVQDLTGGVQDSVFGSETFVVEDTFGSSMGWDDFVRIRDIGDARESYAIKSAAMRLAETIDAYVLNTALLAGNNATGEFGENVQDYGDVASGYTRLKEEGVDDADLCAILNYSDREALSETLTAYPATDSLSTNAFRKGFAGEVNGIPTMFTQQLPTLTTGSRTNGTVAGAGQNVNYRQVAVSAVNGQYLTQEIDLDGLGANATIAKGEVFQIEGVEAFDNRLGASLGRLQDFTVVEDVTANGAGAATVRIFPALVVPGTGTDGDINVNTAHGTVVSAPADNAAVTFKGAASTNFKTRAIIQKEAIIVNTAPLIMPATGTAMNKSLTRIPLNVRMWQNSDFDTGAHSVRFDVALTANIRDRRRIARINGPTA